MVQTIPRGVATNAVSEGCCLSASRESVSEVSASLAQVIDELASIAGVSIEDEREQQIAYEPLH